MSFSDQIEIINVLNIDEHQSTISAQQLPSTSCINDKGFIVSDVDEELLILIQFKEEINLKSIKIYSLQNSIANMDGSNDMSSPQQINIYKLDSLNVNFNDMSTLQSDRTINCKQKKLDKGQTVNLQKSSKEVVRFNQLKYLAIYIKSNQNNTENTFINAITFKGIVKSKAKTNRKANDQPSPEITFVKIPQNTQETKFEYLNRCVLTKNGTKCIHINRIVDAVLYYSSLNINNILDEEGFMKYLNENGTSKYIIDDFIHIILNHNDETKHIYNIIKQKNENNKCEFIRCIFVSRNHKREKQYMDSITVDQVIFWRDFFDALHCYFHHLYDLGLRVDRDDIKYLERDDEVGVKYAEMRDIVIDKITSIKNLQKVKLSRYETNRYELAIYRSRNDEKNPGVTFMDGLSAYMSKQNVANVLLEEMFDDEQYDTDAIEIDILKNNNKNSNIRLWMHDDTEYHLICQYIRSTKLLSYSFKVGYSFHYCKEGTFFPGDLQFWRQPEFGKVYNGAFNGTSMFITITKKYESLKFELLNNKKFSLTKHQLNITNMKAKKYIDTKKVKTISAHRFYEEGFTALFFTKGQVITVEHIMSILLYTDWSELSSKFSATYRGESRYESLQSIKYRHREFANWGKILLEAINVFGNWGYNDALYAALTDEEKQYTEFETGPYYSGLDHVMVVAEFNIRLFSPTSTTKQVEVAERFSGDDGVIIQLNNHATQDSYHLRSWNCSWLSNYIGEDERLWMGGFRTIKVEGILNVSETNYSEYFQPLFYLDCMVSGASMYGVECRPSNIDRVTLLNLIRHHMGIGGYKNRYPKYINDTFRLFVNGKKRIIINIFCVNQYFTKLKDLIMHKIKASINVNSDVKMGNDENLLKPTIFDLFKNVQIVSIDTTVFQDDTKSAPVDYVMNLLRFVSILKESNVSKGVKITIRTRGLEKMEDWLSSLWHKHSQLIAAKCKESNWSVKIGGFLGFRWFTGHGLKTATRTLQFTKL